MMYILGYEIITPGRPNVPVGNTIYQQLACVDAGFQSMLIDTDDSNPHCRWMFVSR